MFDTNVTANADRVANLVRAEFFALPGQGGVVATAPAGAGKTRFVRDTVEEAVAHHDMSLVVATPTNEQMFDLVAPLAAALNPYGVPVHYVPKKDLQIPARAMHPNVVVCHRATDAHGEQVVLGTIDKLGDAFGRGSLAEADGLIIDEAYQADAVRYYMAAELAERHLTVGDAGQIEPFTTARAAQRWRGLPEDPLQTAVGVLTSNRPQTAVHRFPITRRLDRRGATVAQAFYPGHAFSAAVLDGVRQLHLHRVTNLDSRIRTLDHAWQTAATLGWAHLELPDAAVLTCDPDTSALIVAAIERLFTARPRRQCELTRGAGTGPVDLQQTDVCVGVSHNDQKLMIRHALAAAGLGDVTVDTANKLQGRQFEVSVVWHPLAGLDAPDDFHVDPGRLCVLATRHRQACIVVGRAGDRELIDQIPPSTPSYAGCDGDPVLAGWEAHRAVFAALAPARIPIT